MILSTRLTVISYNLRCLHVLFKVKIVYNDIKSEFRFYRKSLIERSDSLKCWKQNDSMVLKHFVSFWRFYSQTFKLYSWKCSFVLLTLIVSDELHPLTLRRSVVSGSDSAAWRHAELSAFMFFLLRVEQDELCFHVLLIYKRWFQVWNDVRSED